LWQTRCDQSVHARCRHRDRLPQHLQTTLIIHS
jgi:hypothetical protein